MNHRALSLFGALVLCATSIVAETPPPVVHDPRLPAGATAAQISAFPLLPEPLQRVGQENSSSAALVVALNSFAGRQETDDFSALEQFVQQHPNSGWTPAVSYNLGKLYYTSGYFSKAMKAYHAAWSASAEADGDTAALIGRQAMAELAVMYGRLGRKEELKELLDTVEGVPFSDNARVQIDRAIDAAHSMEKRPGKSFMCGPYAVRNVYQKITGVFPETFFDGVTSPPRGFSVSEVKALAQNKLQTPMVIVKRQPGEPIPVPSVMHLRSEHFGALVEQANGSYLLMDPTFGNDTWVTEKAIDDEGSGYFLVPADTVPSQAVQVDDVEGAGVFGKGAAPDADFRATSPWDVGCGGLCPPIGMAGYSIHALVASISVGDTPIAMPIAYGPSLSLNVRYNQKEHGQTVTKLNTHFSQQWVSNLVSYLEDNTSNAAANVTVYLAGGGSEVYDRYTSTGVNQGSYAIHRKSGSWLVRIAAGQYELRFRDGSKFVYNRAIGTTGTARKVFLTSMVDSFGNALTLQYNTTYTARVDSVTAADGQQLFFFYQDGTDAYLVTAVADNAVFASATRKTTLAYATTGGAKRLVSITDPVGIVSAFQYSELGFLQKLTTPYGETTFGTGISYQGANLVRWVEATDDQGSKERVELHSDNYGSTIPTGPLPSGTGLSITAAETQYRNTFYWDKAAWHAAPGDVSKAYLYHWLVLTNGASASGVLQRERPALQNDIWYNYPGQTSNIIIGTLGTPSIVARAIESSTGTTVSALSRFEYHAQSGNVTLSTDPDGRTVRYTYDATGIDLLTVEVKDGVNWHTLVTYGNFVNHQAQAVTDVSGKVTNITYNVKGQPTQVTVSKGANSETTKFIYDQNLDGTPDAYGFLIGTEHTSPWNPALFVSSGTLTYDSAKRVRTFTNPEGYTLTYDYDALGRPTTVTHPDSTTEVIEYTQNGRQLLQPTAAKDRAGRWSFVNYNSLGQTVFTIDPANRMTAYEWCRCGSLSKLIDPMGKVTTWKRDVTGRLTEKLLSDGKKYLYTYEPLSGRPATVAYPKDALASQVTITNRYYLTGQLQKMDYTDAGMADLTFTAADFMGRSTGMTDGIGTYTPSYVSLSGAPDGAGGLATLNGPQADDTLRYTYDWLGRVVKNELVKDDGTTVTRSEEATLDSLGRATQVVNNLGTFTATYNSGNLTGVPDSLARPGGFTTLYSRYPANAGANALGLQTIHHKQGVNTVQKHDYAYDLTGNITTWDRTGATSDVTRWALRHDAVDQLVELDESLNSIAQKKEAWHYDAAGNMASSMNVPAGQTGTMQIRTHTGRNQLTQVGGTGKTMVEGTTDEAATVTVNGDAAKVTKMGSSGPWRFERELSFSSGVTAVAIEATDGSSNVTTQNYSVNVSASADQSLTYDDNGNLTQAANGSSVVTRKCEWDVENRLLAIQSAATPALGVKRSEFTYDGAGRRIALVEKEHNGTSWVTQSSWKYLWKGLAMVQKRDASTGTILTNYFGSGEQQGSDAIVYQPDHLGNVRQWYRVSDGSQGSAEFNVWGTRSVIAVGPGVPERGYTGHLHHEVSGLILTAFRAYDPILGRWISEDPIGESGGLNLYGYVGNQAAGSTDPLGLEAPMRGDHALGLSWMQRAMAGAAGAGRYLGGKGGPCPKPAPGPGPIPFPVPFPVPVPDPVPAPVPAPIPVPAPAPAPVPVPEPDPVPEPAPEPTPATDGAGARKPPRGSDDPIRFHHAWPMYLGGPRDQLLEPLPKSLHDAYHRGLDKVLDNSLARVRTTAHFSAQTGAERIRTLKALANYTRAFDAKHGTKLYEAMIREGFPILP